LSRQFTTVQTRRAASWQPRAGVPPPTTESPLESLVPAAWRTTLREVLSAPSTASLERFLRDEARAATVLPRREQLFAALALTPLPAVRAVILGQDPYPTVGNANGLAFSVAPGAAIPASLRNLFAGLAIDLGLPRPGSGDLSPWARAGVLLLNSTLTVRVGKPGSHRKRGWEPVTRAVLAAVAGRAQPTVFFCFGKEAQAVAAACVVGAQHLVIPTPHPSPLTGGAFLRAVEKDRPFSRANAFLEAAGLAPLDLRLPRGA
jgi:uracil-DNA glycosylase